jgi:hypothetical protein
LNWNHYSFLINQKLQDAQHNVEHAERKCKDAKTVYWSLLKEKESFENALTELLEKGENDEI